MDSTDEIVPPPGPGQGPAAEGAPADPAATDDPDRAGLTGSRRRIPGLVKVLGAILGVLTIVIVVAAFVKVPYYLLSPGSARATEPLIEVEGAESFEHPGEVEFATVSLQKATAMQAVMGWLDPTVDVVEEDRIEGDKSPSEVRTVNLAAMASSKDVATAVALDELGYEVGISGVGAQIVRVEEGSPADGVLAVGDVVVQADGQPVTLNRELVEIIQAHAPGDVLTMAVQTPDSDAPVSKVAVLGSSPDDATRAFLGVASITHGLQYQFPFTVTIDSGTVGGPSAGLAFTLGIMDTLSPESITGGHRIATTGTMSPDGAVGPVGGVAQKTVAVRRAGAELFLVPSSEYQQAKEFAGDMPIVAVDTLDDALAALAAFRGGTQPNGAALADD